MINIAAIAVISSPNRRQPLIIGGSAGQAIVAWDVVSGASGYKVYWGQTSGGPYLQAEGAGYDAGNVLEYTVSGLAAGTWYFKVTSYGPDALSEIGLDFVDQVSKLVT